MVRVRVTSLWEQPRSLNQVQSRTLLQLVVTAGQLLIPGFKVSYNNHSGPLSLIICNALIWIIYSPKMLTDIKKVTLLLLYCVSVLTGDRSSGLDVNENQVHLRLIWPLSTFSRGSHWKKKVQSQKRLYLKVWGSNPKIKIKEKMQRKEINKAIV